MPGPQRIPNLCGSISAVIDLSTFTTSVGYIQPWRTVALRNSEKHTGRIIRDSPRSRHSCPSIGGWRG